MKHNRHGRLREGPTAHCVSRDRGVVPVWLRGGRGGRGAVGAAGVFLVTPTPSPGLPLTCVPSHTHTQMYCEHRSVVRDRGVVPCGCVWRGRRGWLGAPLFGCVFRGHARLPQPAPPTLDVSHACKLTLSGGLRGLVDGGGTVWHRRRPSPI